MDRTKSVGDFEREAVDTARVMTPAERLREGLRLFDRVCHVMAAGIRHQHPHADAGEVLRLLRERFRTARSLERL